MEQKLEAEKELLAYSQLVRMEQIAAIGTAEDLLKNMGVTQKALSKRDVKSMH